MDDLADRVSRLGERSIKANAERQREEKRLNAMAKARVREISPEIADCLNITISAFNCEAYEVIDANKNVIYKKGEFQPPRDLRVKIQKNRKDYYDR